MSLKCLECFFNQLKSLWKKLTDAEVCGTTDCANGWREANFVFCWSQSCKTSRDMYIPASKWGTDVVRIQIDPFFIQIKTCPEFTHVLRHMRMTWNMIRYGNMVWAGLLEIKRKHRSAVKIHRGLLQRWPLAQDPCKVLRMVSQPVSQETVTQHASHAVLHLH